MSRRAKLGVCSISQPACSSLQNRSLARQFEQEAQARAIQSCRDIEELRDLALSLLKAWHMQTDMTQHFGAQAMGYPERIKA